MANEVTEVVGFRLQFPRALEAFARCGFKPEEVPDLRCVGVNPPNGAELRGALKP